MRPPVSLKQLTALSRAVSPEAGRYPVTGLTSSSHRPRPWASLSVPEAALRAAGLGHTRLQPYLPRSHSPSSRYVGAINTTRCLALVLNRDEERQLGHALVTSASSGSRLGQGDRLGRAES